VHVLFFLLFSWPTTPLDYLWEAYRAVRRSCGDGRLYNAVKQRILVAAAAPEAQFSHLGIVLAAARPQKDASYAARICMGLAYFAELTRGGNSRWKLDTLNSSIEGSRKQGAGQIAEQVTPSAAQLILPAEGRGERHASDGRIDG
jgi:hypothetical protein